MSDLANRKPGRDAMMAPLTGEQDLQRVLFEQALAGATRDRLFETFTTALERDMPGLAWRVAMPDDQGSSVLARSASTFSPAFLGAVGGDPAADPLHAEGVTVVTCLDARHESRWRRHAAACLVEGFCGFIVESFDSAAARVAFYWKPRAVDVDLAVVRSRVASLDLALRALRSERGDQATGDVLKSLSRMIPGVVYQRLVTATGDIRYTYISEGARDMFGVEPERILNDPEALFQHYDADYSRTFRQRLIEASQKLTHWDVEATIRLPDGRVRFTHAVARPHKLADGSVLWTGVILDASRIKEAEAAAAAVEANTRSAIVEGLAQAILLFDVNDRLVIANSQFRTLYPALGAVAVPGTSYADFIEAETLHLLEQAQINRAEAEERRARIAHREARACIGERSLGDDSWIMVTESYDTTKGSVLIYTDVSELKRREHRIHHLAYNDVLTGLANRSSFRQRLSEALQRTANGEGASAVLCLDLDSFKLVNDTLGHPAGDRLLKMVAERLKGVIRATDTVARLGGDEFAILVDGLPSPDYATTLAWRVLNVIGQFFDLDGQQVISTTSIGIAFVRSGETVDPDVILKNADLALYRAKADGRNAFQFFEPEMDARAQKRRALEHDLRSAIERNELEVYYQPQVDVVSEQVTGMEALLRWRHPTRGLVPPLEFIPLAEETGLIIRIGAWVLRRACLDAAQWPSSARVAVNVSPAQFLKRDLVHIVKDALAESGLPANRLEIEITESLLLRDTAVNLSTLRDLKDLGVRISMDDFGTGYSSLANLRSFPFDKIKIDKSFVDGLDNNTDSAAIVRAVLSLGRGLGMTTTAEGVETGDQLAYLRAEGCLEVQGFYFSRPVPNSKVARLLRGGFLRPHGKPHAARSK